MAEIMILLAIGFVALKAFGSISAGFFEVRSKFAEVRAKESDSKLKLADAERKSAEAEEIRERTRNMRKKVDADVMKNLAEAKRIVEESKYRAFTGQHAVVINNRTGKIGQYIAPPKRLLTQEQPQQKQEQLEDRPKYTAIDIIKKIADQIQHTKNAPRFVFAGPPRAGKTSTAIAVTHMIPGIYCALDPKDADPEEPWPKHINVLGNGDNWVEMKKFFRWLFEVEQPRRAALLRNDPKKFKALPFLVAILEELISTLMGIPELADQYITALTKFSQYKIGIIVITHATTATAMGFKPGYAELKLSFDAIFRFDYDPLEDTRAAFVQMRGKSEMELRPCKPVLSGGDVGGVGVQNDTGFSHKNGFFSRSDSSDKSDGSDRQPVIMLPAPPKRRYQSVAHKEAVEAYLGGRTPNWICVNILMGRGRKKYKPNSRDYTELRRILSLYGIQERRG